MEEAIMVPMFIVVFEWILAIGIGLAISTFAVGVAGLGVFWLFRKLGLGDSE